MKTVNRVLAEIIIFLLLPLSLIVFIMGMVGISFLFYISGELEF